MSELKGKIDFTLFISATNANPNGDPLNGNRPRINMDGYGEISDVCIKRKIRNRLQDRNQKIFVQSDDRTDDSYTSLKDRADSCEELKKEMSNKKSANRDSPGGAGANGHPILFCCGQTAHGEPVHPVRRQFPDDGRNGGAGADPAGYRRSVRRTKGHGRNENAGAAVRGLHCRQRGGNPARSAGLAAALRCGGAGRGRQYDRP